MMALAFMEGKEPPGRWPGPCVGTKLSAVSFDDLWEGYRTMPGYGIVLSLVETGGAVRSE